MRARRAFIFTADAVLAFYLITIILSILMLLSYSPKLYIEQSQALARDTLVALSSIKLIDVRGNPQYGYTNSLLNIQNNSIPLWPMLGRTVEHNVSVASVYPSSNSTWLKYSVGASGAINTKVRSTPLVYYGKVIATSENATYAFDENSGMPIWRDIRMPADSTPTTYRGRILVGSLRGVLYSLDEMGQAVWNITLTSSIISSPLVHNGKVFVGLTNGSMLALDVESGVVANFSFTAPSQSNITSSPVVYNKQIFVFSSNNNTPMAYISSVDEDTGAVLWSYPLPSGKYIYLFVDPSPTVSNGIVYLSNGYTVFAMNATTGFTLWRYDDPNGAVKFTSSPAIDGTSLLIGCNNSLTGIKGVCIIDTKTQSFSIALVGVGVSIYSTPVIVNDSVILGGSDGILRVVKKQPLVAFSSVQILWSYNIGQPIYSSPAVVNGRIYIGGDDGNITAFGNCSIWDNNMSVIDSIAAFWSINRTDCARAIASEFLDSALPQNYGFELVIKPAGGSGVQCFSANPNCYYCNGTVSKEWDSMYTNDCNQTKYQRFLIRDSRYLSRVSQKGSPIYYSQNPIEVELRIWN